MEALTWDWNFHYQMTIAALTYWRAYCTRVGSFSCVCLTDFRTNESLMESLFFLNKTDVVVMGIS